MQQLIHRLGLLLGVLSIVSAMLLLNPSSAKAQVRLWRPNGEEAYGFFNACRDGMQYEISIDQDTDPHNQQPFTASLRIDTFAIGDGLITSDDSSGPIFIGDVAMTYDRSTANDHVYIGVVRWDSAIEPGQMFLNPEILNWPSIGGAIEASELPLIQDCLHTPDLPNTPPDSELIALGSLVGLGDKCMDVLGPGITNSSPTQLWDCTGETDQLWGLTDTGLIIHHSGKCLGVRNAYSADGTVVDVYDCIDAVNQFWKMTDSGSVIDFGGKCLDTAENALTHATTTTQTERRYRYQPVQIQKVSSGALRSFLLQIQNRPHQQQTQSSG